MIGVKMYICRCWFSVCFQKLIKKMYKTLCINYRSTKGINKTSISFESMIALQNRKWSLFNGLVKELVIPNIMCKIQLKK